MLTTTASCVCHMQHETRVNAMAKLETDTSMTGMRFTNIPCMHKRTETRFDDWSLHILISPHEKARCLAEACE